jgi:hypothetical protein
MENRRKIRSLNEDNIVKPMTEYQTSNYFTNNRWRLDIRYIPGTLLVGAIYTTEQRVVKGRVAEQQIDTK